MHLDEKILSSGASVSNAGAGGGVSGGGEDDSEDTLSVTGPGTGAGALGMTGGGGMEPIGPVTSSTISSTQVDYLQYITLQFDKPTTYLSIPLKKLKYALQNETHRVNIGKVQSAVVFRIL